MTDRIPPRSRYFAPAGQHENGRHSSSLHVDTASRRGSTPPQANESFNDLPPRPRLGALADYISELQVSGARAQPEQSGGEPPATGQHPPAAVELVGFDKPAEVQKRLHVLAARPPEPHQSALRPKGAVFPTQPISGASARVSLFELAQAHHKGEPLGSSFLDHMTLKFVLAYICAQPKHEQPDLARRLVDGLIAEAKLAHGANAHEANNIQSAIQHTERALVDLDLDSADDDVTIEGAFYKLFEFGKTVGIVPDDVPPFAR